MKLRVLEEKDAPFMCEWMRDPSITKYLHTDFSRKTIDDAKDFIESSKYEENLKSYAIVSDEDEYMGTVSLKTIDLNNKNAQLSIVVRKKAMAHGYAWFAICEILRIAFEDLKLKSVYWCVSNLDDRATRFCDKHYFKKVLDVPEDIRGIYPDRVDLVWYLALNGDDYLNEALGRVSIAGCDIINIKTIPTVNAGELSFFETQQDIGFNIKRIYYISKVPEGTRRGFHAHKKLKQLLFCPYGRIQLILDNGKVREEITLSDPSIGVVLDKPVWREMLWLQKDSVLCVAGSEYYDENDYIRDYHEYTKFVGDMVR